MDELADVEKVNADIIAKISSNEEIKEEFGRIMDVVTNKANVAETRNKPNQILEKAADSIEAIDKRIIKKLTEEQKDEIKDNLERLEALIGELKEVVNV